MSTTEAIARAVWFLLHHERWPVLAVCTYTDLTKDEVLRLELYASALRRRH